MSGRMLSSLVVFCIFAAMLAFIAWPRSYKAEDPASSSATFFGATGTGIQSKGRVFDMTGPDGFTKVGIMAAYDPRSHAFWWRPTPFIAEPSMLERYFERCKFQMDGDRLLNFCVRANEVVISTTAEHAPSLDQGLDNAETNLRTRPGLLMTYRGPQDSGFDLQQKAGVDMNTAEGVRPTVVRSVRKTSAGWELDVTCGCGNATISLNGNFDFAGIKRN